MNQIIQDKVNELAKQHIEILEQECKKVCNKFNCNADDLIIEFHANTEIIIQVKASHFTITNKFEFSDNNINSEINMI